MRTVLIALATLAVWHLARWVWARMGDWDVDAAILTWRPRLIARREADQARDRALLAARQDWHAERDQAVAEALAVIVDDPRTAEEAAELKAVFERVHADERWKDLSPAQQTAAARRIQKLGMERLGYLDTAASKPPSGRQSVPKVQ